MRTLQYISLDDIAKQSLELATLSKTSQVINTSIDQLERHCVLSYQQVIVLSSIDEPTVLDLVNVLKDAVHPIVVIPEHEEMDTALRILLNTHIIVVRTKVDTLQAIALSETLQHLETFFISGAEDDLTITEDELFNLLQTHSFNRFYSAQGKTAQIAMLRVMNMVDSLESMQSALGLFRLHPDASLMDISNAIDIISNKVNPDADMMFQTRGDITLNNKTECIVVVCQYVDILPSLQKKIDLQSTYIEKSTEIVDAYANREITGEDADTIAEHNHIALKDLEFIYHMAYVEKLDLSLFIQALRLPECTDEERQEVIAEAIVQKTVNLDILNELAMTYQLSVDKINDLVDQQNAQKQLEEAQSVATEEA